MDDLIERAQTRAHELRAGIARSNSGVDLELLAEILNEMRISNGRLPNEDVPRSWLRWYGRFKRWISYAPVASNDEAKE